MEHGRKTGRIIRLPLVERFTVIGRETRAETSVLMEVDEVGLFVYYRKEHENHVPTPEEVRRRHLIGLKHTHCYIEASTLSGAINRFFREWPGATTGKKAQALMVDERPDARIEVYPECQHMHYTEDETIVCGKVQSDGINGEHGGCVLEGFDPPGFPCPIERFWLMKKVN